MESNKEILAMEGVKVYRHDQVVNFKVEYSKDYAKKKHMKDGIVLKLHVLHAERLEKKKLGKIVK